MRKLCQLLAFSVLIFATLPVFSRQHIDRSRLNSLYQAQQYETAVQYLETAYKGQVLTPAQHGDLGYAYFLNDQPAAAKAHFLSLFGSDSVNVMANIHLAELYDQFDRPDSALGFWLRLCRAYPAHAGYFARAGNFFTAMTAFDSALVYTAKAYELKPTSGRLLVQYVNLLVRRKTTQAVDSLLDEFLRRDSTNEEVIAKRIDYSFKKTKPEHPVIIRWGEKLWKDSSKLVAPFVNLAYSYLNTDNLNKCLAVSHWLMDNNRATQPLLYCAALAYSRKKNYDSSNYLLDECLKLSLQSDAVIYFNAKADNYEAMKDYRRSATFYDTSYYIFKVPMDLYYAGRVYDKYFNNRSKAAAYYKRFLEKQKTPRNSGEQRIFDYVREYLAPRPR